MLAVKLTALESAGGDVDAMWAFPMERDAAGAAGALATMPGKQPSGNGTIIYFSCADCAVEAG